MAKLSGLLAILLLAAQGTAHAGHMADVLNGQEAAMHGRTAEADGRGTAESAVRSAGRAIQVTPEAHDCLASGRSCGQILFQADVGNERWSINGDLATDIFTGNVFFEDLRAPAFLWCPIVDTQGQSPTGAFVLDCFAALSCAGVGCSPGQWQELGLFTLPMSYLLP